jgi:oxygen-independent coproporphyrinogen-3 oxidase
VASIISIIDLLAETFDLEDIGEITIECNPEPPELIYNLIKTLYKTYRNFPRIRLSIGIQTFDNEILKESHRQYRFNQVIEFLRTIQKLRKANISYNLDFIAFGKWRTLRNGERELWRKVEREFFNALVASHMADSYSVYTLELFPGSKWYSDRIQQTDKLKDGHGLKQFGSDDDVYDEFSLMKDTLLINGYRRYELSNFALAGKSSVHNRAYREMETYIGLGSGASSFAHAGHSHYDAIVEHLGKDKTETSSGVRRNNTKVIKKYFS